MTLHFSLKQSFIMRCTKKYLKQGLYRYIIAKFIWFDFFNNVDIWRSRRKLFAKGMVG